MRLATYKKSGAAFVMLEAVLALGLFATVATAMAVALNQLSSASTLMRREALLLRQMESAMTEAAHRRPLTAKFETRPEDEFGVRLETQIAPVNLTSERGEALDGIYEVTVTAILDDGSEQGMRRALGQLVFADGGGSGR